MNEFLPGWAPAAVLVPILAYLVSWVTGIVTTEETKFLDVTGLRSKLDKLLPFRLADMCRACAGFWTGTATVIIANLVLGAQDRTAEWVLVTSTEILAVFGAHWAWTKSRKNTIKKIVEE